MLPHQYAVLQWSGLVALAVALLALIWTRWGQARPLYKCIALSVFAHILLIIYAHGIELILPLPEAAGEPFIRVALIADPSDGLSTESENSAEEADLWSLVDADRAPAERSPEETDSQPLAAEAAEQSSWRDEDPEPVVDSSRPAALVPARLVSEPPAFDAPERVTDPEPSESGPRAEPPPDTVAPLEAANEIVPTAAAAEPVEPVERPSGPATGPEDVADATPDLVSSESPPAVDPEELPRMAELEGVEPLEVFDDVSNAVAPSPPVPVAVEDRNDWRRAVDTSTSGEGSRRRLRAGDGTPLTALFSHRDEQARDEILQKYGGSRETEACVAACLAWLVEQQQPDGRWDAARHGAGRDTRVLGHDRQRAGADADSGITGLALLALQGAGNSHLEGPYQSQVQRGLEYLLSVQRADGCLAGEASLFARMYCHGIASLAISEAFAMTGDERLEPYVERAVAYTVGSQHPVTGGWRYQPGDRGDMSQFGWQVMALKSAEIAGIPVAGKTRSGMLRFLQGASSGTHGGLASYRAGDRVSAAMTAEALVCRFFLQRRPDAALVSEATGRILHELPGEGMANLYFWYYGTLAIFQVQGEAWVMWNEALQRQLLARQRTGGSLAGSFDPDTVWGGYGGRVYSTAMAALCLEVYYRYLPVYDLGD